MRFASGSVASIAFVVAACNTVTHERSKRTPVIDEIAFPAAATPTPAGWSVAGTIKFHDEDDVVQRIHVATAEAPYADARFEITPVQLGQVNVAIPFGRTVPDGGVGFVKGTYTLVVTGIDAEGIEGLPATRTVELP